MGSMSPSPLLEMEIRPAPPFSRPQLTPLTAPGLRAGSVWTLGCSRGPRKGSLSKSYSRASSWESGVSLPASVKLGTELVVTRESRAGIAVACRG